MDPGFYNGPHIAGFTSDDRGAMAEIRDEDGLFVYDGKHWRGPFGTTGEALAFRRTLSAQEA